jgi:hypothetical protein
MTHINPTNKVSSSKAGKLCALEQRFSMYWIYLLPSTQQTIGYNGFTTTRFDSHESSSGYV